VQAARGAPLTPPPARPRRLGLLLGVAAFVLAADIVSKAVAVAHLHPGSQVHLIGTVLMLTLTRNGGAAFSIGTSLTVVFTAIAVGVIVYILRAARKLRSTGWAIALGLLLGGATGNLVDRIFRAPGPFRGDVIDWIELTRYWPVFNLADSAITCAAVLVVLLALLGIHLDGTRTAREPAAPSPGAAVPPAAAPPPAAAGQPPGAWPPEVPPPPAAGSRSTARDPG
jgi:signal peptidase II